MVNEKDDKSKEPKAGTDPEAMDGLNNLALSLDGDGKGPKAGAGPSLEETRIEPAKPAGEDWLPVIAPAIDIGISAAPRWTWPAEAVAQLKAGLSEVLHKVMPLDNAEAWAPWAKITFSLGTIAMANFNFETGRFNPMRDEDGESGNGRENNRPDGEKPQR